MFDLLSSPPVISISEGENGYDIKIGSLGYGEYALLVKHFLITEGRSSGPN